MAYYSRKRPVVKGEKGGSAGPGKWLALGKIPTLPGIAELAGGYVGGPSHSGRRGRGSEKARMGAPMSNEEQSACYTKT